MDGMAILAKTQKRHEGKSERGGCNSPPPPPLLRESVNLANLDLSMAEAVKIGNQPLTRVHSTKFLGVLIDQRLVWEVQIDCLCNRISSALGALKQARRYVPQNTLITIYNALIKPLFDYCDVVWGNLNKTLTA